MNPPRTANTRPAPNRILAIDGPAGAGKSTVAARMAARFGLLNIETGAMYRALGLRALGANISLEDGEALARLLARTSIKLVPGPGGNRIQLDQADVTAQLRTARVTDAASRVSVHASVRSALVRLQQQLGASPQAKASHGIVMEGRDIGTVVFPEASLKIFLSASPEARTERRLAQTPTAGQSPNAEATLAALKERDHRDSTREVSPLRPADDAVVLDSTDLPLPEVMERVAALVMERWQLAPLQV